VLLEESLALYRGLDDKRGLARTLYSFGIVLMDQEEKDRARALFEEGLSLAREIGAGDLVSSTLNALGEMARGLGDYERSRVLYEEAMTAAPEVSYTKLVPLYNLGLVAFSQGDPTVARSNFAGARAIASKLGHKPGIPSALEGLAGVYGVQGEPERAARLFGAAEALRKATNLPIQTSDRADYERFVAGARAALDEEAFAAAWKEGGALTLEQAIELALP